MVSLNARAWLALASVAVVMGLVLFGAAGTLHYWGAWVYLAVFFGPSALVTVYLMRRDPALLERRMRGGPTAEPEPAQRIIMWLVSLGFIALLVVPALDHRFGWSELPPGAALAGDALVLIGFYGIFRVYRVNTFGGATIRVTADQKVITTGPYAVVRHPMYASASLYLIGTPLALGSCWGLVPLALIVPAVIWRLLDEERLLARDLPGYSAYQRQVRYRLLPGIW
jgi:protein-S-isoprenylcysteine O-methyltransferase Ste14